MGRIIVVGRSSQVWRRVQAARLVPSDYIAIGHRDIEAFDFSPSDVIWIFSYAPTDDGNRQLLEALRKRGARQVAYLSSATACVAELTDCFRYPRVKLAAEKLASNLLDADLCRVGYMYDDAKELPAGDIAATRYAELAAAMREPLRPVSERSMPRRLYTMKSRPFDSAFEQGSFRVYTLLVRWAGAWPCLLRPFDMILRALGYRWYGYVFISNQCCMSTT